MDVQTSSMDINSKTVAFANKIIQTRNISEASSWKDEKGKPGIGVYILAGILILAGLGALGSNFLITLILVAVGAAIIWGCMQWKPTYELQLQTNAGKVTALSSKDEAFIDDILQRIHRAMAEPNSTANYHVNVDAKTIQENKVTVSNSTGVNVVGGDATSTTQTAVVSGATLADVSNLIEIVRSSSAANREELQSQLEDVRNFMAGGGKSKEDARLSWQKFVGGVGALSSAGASVWDLVGKVSSLFAPA
ncbi:MAG TPA: DUF6232 family protein [Caulobacterales bacterium]|nr:DUF6232 family protein [Caulobacterales bacterium]